MRHSRASHQGKETGSEHMLINETLILSTSHTHTKKKYIYTSIHVALYYLGMIIIIAKNIFTLTWLVDR